MAAPRSRARQESSITSSGEIGMWGVIALVGIIPVGQKLTISSGYGVSGNGFMPSLCRREWERGMASVEIGCALLPFLGRGGLPEPPSEPCRSIEPGTAWGQL